MSVIILVKLSLLPQKRNLSATNPAVSAKYAAAPFASPATYFFKQFNTSNAFFSSPGCQLIEYFALKGKLMESFFTAAVFVWLLQLHKMTQAIIKRRIVFIYDLLFQ